MCGLGQCRFLKKVIAWISTSVHTLLMTNATTITSLKQLSAKSVTAINATANVVIPGFHLDWDGNGESATAQGARYTLRADATDARVRDLVIG